MYNIFQDCMLCNDGNTLYTGDRKKRLELKNTMIPTDSPVAHIIADAVEDGWSERQVVVIANQYLLEQSQDFITRNQLRSLVHRMKPVVSAVEKAKQGSSDPDAPWSKARYNWILQLLVRFGVVQVPNPPSYHDHTQVTPLSLHQIAWWDEKHRKVQVSSAHSRKPQT